MPSRIRTVLVDDEKASRIRLRALLNDHPDILIVAEATDIASAAAACELHSPDLVLLDIQLRRENGFALIPLLKHRPKIIFITAHPQFAAQAFDVQANDYLLKPVNPARLAIALDRIRTERPTDVVADETRVTLRENKRVQVIPWSRISHIESAQNYSKVHVQGDTPMLVRRSLSEWDRLLPRTGFHRIGRSLILRRASIQKIQSVSRDIHHVFLIESSSPLVLSRQAGRILIRLLGSPHPPSSNDA